MAITFRGRDLVVRFKENELNGAERMYQVRYQCATNMVVHNILAEDFYEQDPSTQLRRYVDTLRYDENVANGLTRSPVVSMRTQNANGVFSGWQNIDASNPLPVLAGTPLIDPTLTGVQIRLIQPDDDDLVGFAVWVSDKPGVPLTDGYLRHQGASTSIDIPLPSDDTYYMRVAPYDAFGLDPAAAFPEMSIKRRPLGGEIVNSPPWRQLPDLVTGLITTPIEQLSALQIEYGTSNVKLTQALNKENLVAIREFGTRVDESGAKIAEDMLQLTSRLTDAEKAVAGIDIKGPIEAGLSELRRSIANANYASSEVVDIKIANYGDGVTAWQTNEERVRSERDKAIAEDIEKMGVRITDEVGGVKTSLEGSFNDLRKLVVDNEFGTALALRVDEMGVRITTEVDGEKLAREAAIRTVQQSIVDGDFAQSNRTDTLNAYVDGIVGPNGPIAGINGVIQTIQEVEARNDGARAQEIRNVQSQLDGLNYAAVEEKVNTYANKVDGIGAQYVLKVQTDVNGVKSIAGMGIAVENGVSAIAFNADSFRIATPGQSSKQIFYGDSEGVYMPNVRVDTLTYGALVDQFSKGQSLLDPAGGYQRIPGGLIMMWGQYRGAIRSETTFSIPFPIQFPSQCLCVNVTPYLNFFNNERDLWMQIVGQASPYGFTVASQAARSVDQNIDGFNWMAFGI